MGKPICAKCQTARGKRICKLQQDRHVCAPCCATSRNAACQGCRHDQTARAYQASKPVAVRRREFILAVDPVVEEAADRALLAFERNQMDAGLAILQPLLAAHPGNHMAQYAMGVAHAMRGDLLESIAYFNRALEIYPYFIEAAFNRALAYQKLLDIKNLIEALEYVVEIADEDDDLGRKAKNQLDDMAEHIWRTEGMTLRAYLGVKPIFEQGVEAMEQKRWLEALDAFTRVAAAHPRGHLQSFGNMGLCYAQLGRRREALEALDRALERNPAYELAVVNRIKVERMNEGEPLGGEIATTEYFREYPMKNRSYIQEVFEESQNQGSKIKSLTRE